MEHVVPAGAWSLARYAEHWKTIYPRRRVIAWRDGWIANGYCRDCRYCCGPQASDTPFPMPLLKSQLRPDIGDDFYMLNENTACLDRRGCKACGPKGCCLQRQQRPPSCGLFPIVLANGGLWLYKTCPAVILNPPILWLGLAARVATWLAKLDRTDLEHLALSLDWPTLAKSYLDLDCAVSFSQASGAWPQP